MAARRQRTALDTVGQAVRICAGKNSIGVGFADLVAKPIMGIMAVARRKKTA